MNKLTVGLISVGIALSLVAVVKVSTNNSTAADTEEKTLVSTSGLVTILPVTDKSPTTLKLKELNLSGPRQVYITGVIEDYNSQAAAKQILELGKTSEPMTIILNSPGGSVFDGAEVISAIEAAKGPVNTLCVQLCASMAAMIHQYGTNRLMLNRAVLMFHPAAGGVQGTLDQIGSRYSLFKSFIGKMEAHVALRAKTSLADYKARSGVELWLDSEDAVRQGYADQLVFVRGSNANKLFDSQGQLLRIRRQIMPQVIPQVAPNAPVIQPVNEPAAPVAPKFYWF